MFVEANNMVINNYVVIPVVSRPTVTAVGLKLNADQRLGQQYLGPVRLVQGRVIKLNVAVGASAPELHIVPRGIS